MKRSNSISCHSDQTFTLKTWVEIWIDGLIFEFCNLKECFGMNEIV